MKIAILVPGGVDRSGTERVIPCLLWLVERLAKDAEVHLFALDQEPLPGTWPLLGATVHNAGRRPQRLRTLAQMMVEHRRGRFDVVHAWWATGPGVIAAAFKRMTGVPVVLTLPGGDLVGIPDIRYGAQLSRRSRMWVRIAVANANRVLVPSYATQIEARQAGVEAERVPLGVALDRWPPRPPRRRISGEPFRLVHVANLNPVKDQVTLLRAMEELRQRRLSFTLDVIGLDTLDGAVQRLSAELALDEHVRFHGFMPHAGMRPFIENADLLVISSRSETVPMVLSEAAVAGVPTVGTAVGQIADWAPLAALAVETRNSTALADAITALSADEDRRLAIATEAQKRALVESADVTAALTRSIYAELAKRG